MAVLATEHIRSKNTDYNPIGSFTLQYMQQISDVEVSCMAGRFLNFGTDMLSSQHSHFQQEATHDELFPTVNARLPTARESWIAHIGTRASSSR